MVREDEDYFSHETEVFNEFIRLINEALTQHDEVYVDATHINEQSREKTMRRITVGCKVIPIVFVTPLSTCLEWNAKREGRARVPDSVIRNMHKDFHDPTDDSREYPEVWFINPTVEGIEFL